MYCFFLKRRRTTRSKHCISSAAQDVYKRQVVSTQSTWEDRKKNRKNKKREMGKKRKDIKDEIQNGKKEVRIGKNNYELIKENEYEANHKPCLLYTSPSPRDQA
eukprot:TRINITY_DN5594_c0_g1_i1.p3 TRINITY_DN5594_c0_g1~~TRINITY_DN5594_c0_g1_i1.p3  ORF type:complete len:104 (-),score=26.63 TRINITY_DN5594_c0_g1_i1:47-358(-)